jgi:hypothetical protein
MVLTMVYNTENDLVSGVLTLSGIQNTRRHNVSETGSAFVLRFWGVGGRHLGPVTEVRSF